ncbi:MAG: SDR family oxidoreductase [Alistipes sp.]|nr:SDR family oxidoreductase [Alistipes sp.]
MADHNPFKLERKKILVTGASSGIGRAIAIESSRLGAEVIITGRDKKRLEETSSHISTMATNPVVANLATEEGINTLVDSIPALDGIVHCAGIAQPIPFRFIDKDKIDKIMSVNFFAPAILTQKLLQSKKINSPGSIVFISSVSGVYCSSIGGSIYSASKGAINGMVKGLAIELANRNIRVNCVNPGMVNTGIYDEGTITQEQLQEDAKKYPLRRYGQPEEIAYAVIYLLSDASAWVTGTNLLIDGGYTLL